MRQTRIAAGAFAMLLSMTAPETAGAFSYYEPTPAQTVGVSRPEIKQAFILGPGESFERVTMTIDGTVVPAAWNDGTGVVAYTPEAPLSQGMHQARIAVQITHPNKSQGWFYDPLVYDLSFTVSSAAVDSLPVPKAPDLNSLRRLNEIRRAAGLPDVAYNRALGAASAGHASWVEAHGMSHYETPGTTRFFGVGPSERATFYGYTDGVAEVIQSGVPESAIDEWVSTLYHRIPLLNPGNTEAGYGQSGKDSVMLMGPHKQTDQLVVYPADGQTDVYVSWRADTETPRPLRLYPGATDPVGTTVSLQVGRRPQAMLLTAASLTGPNGQSVPAMSFSPANDDHLTDTVAMIPYAPLSQATTYTARMTGTVDYGDGPQPFDMTWRFTTRGTGHATTKLPADRPVGASFPDLDGHWAEDAVRELYDKDIVSGMPDGSFRPNGTITRSAFLKMLVAARQIAPLPQVNRWFTDMWAHWSVANGYLGAGVEAGIIFADDYPSGMFEPERNITREEIATWLVRAIRNGNDPVNSSQDGPDQSEPAMLFRDTATWRQPSEIAAAVSLGLAKGVAESDGTFTFRPSSEATRAEAAMMVHRMLSVRKQRGSDA